MPFACPCFGMFCFGETREAVNGNICSRVCLVCYVCSAMWLTRDMLLLLLFPSFLHEIQNSSHTVDMYDYFGGRAAHFASCADRCNMCVCVLFPFQERQNIKKEIALRQVHKYYQPYTPCVREKKSAQLKTPRVWRTFAVF